MKMNKERLNFDPVKEVSYLGQFSDELRKRQLETEISTALSELLLSEYSHDYLWRDGKIIDKNTGIEAKSLSRNCEYESKKVDRIEEELEEGKELVVGISPKNKELDYPDDMVDFWKRGEGDKLTLMRFKVEMSPEQLRDFEKIDKENYKMGDLIKMLNLAKSDERVSISAIEKITQSLVERFNREFGEKIFVDAELITRLFVATRLEVERQGEVEPVVGRWAESLYGSRMQNYLFGQLKTVLVSGGGCGGRSISGRFASEGIIIIKNVDGITFRKGSTEGLTYCTRCGCWYSGDKCPICK
ncbi:MAG TPA: hypothetical protein PLU63_01470 [Candidatus Woesebacteria bacterium]|nr:hypothetical protein [Candidatus Woesebacteria bacterium]